MITSILRRLGAMVVPVLLCTGCLSVESPEDVAGEATRQTESTEMAPLPTEDGDRSATAYPEPSGEDAQATAYPPPMQTEKAVEATEAAEQERARETAAAVGVDSPVSASDMVTFTSPVLGLAFAYPSELGAPELTVRPGETGEYWRLRFPRYNALSMAGTSPDFSEGRGGMFEDTYGYARDEAGELRWLTVPSRSVGGRVIEAEEVINSDSGVEIMLFLLPPPMGSPDDAEPGPLAALVNLAGERFPGMIVLNGDPGRLPEATLRAILERFEVSAPAD